MKSWEIIFCFESGLQFGACGYVLLPYDKIEFRKDWRLAVMLRVDARIHYWEYKAFDAYSAIFIDRRFEKELNGMLTGVIAGIAIYVCYSKTELLYTLLTINLIRLIAFLFDIKSRSYRFDYKHLRFIYDFNTDGLSYEWINEDTSCRLEFDYSKITKAVERKKAFYLFIEEDEQFIIPKRCIANGMPETVADILKSKLGLRYVPQMNP